MNKNKEIWITGFALFSLFFGAGNLLLPPFLGYNASDNWFWVALGFMITAVAIPLIGIIAHAKLQGTLYDFGKKVSHRFSIVFCVLIYCISIAIPSPRTASATHEIAIEPFFGTSALLTSCIYFSLVLIFVLNRSKTLNLIGKYVTPLIVAILILMIGIGLFSSEMEIKSSLFSTPFVDGLLEGYQTFDAIGAVVVGGVIIISLHLKGHQSYEIKKNIIRKSGMIAGSGLFIMYAGMIAVGAFFGTEIFVDNTLSSDHQRTEVLRGISLATLSNIGNAFLSILIGLACFTTAVGIVTGTSDYFKGLFKNSQKVFVGTAIFSCLIGVLIGQLNFHDIVMIALPILMFIYPITIVLILLNVINEQFATPKIFKVVVLVTFIFSIPDFLGFIIPSENLVEIKRYIPLSKHNLGWVLPALITFFGFNFTIYLKSIK